jgi:CRISPR-associated endonuclease/helicase Cas3
MTKQATLNQQDGLLLPGLDGSNPLGFLASLGLFRVISVALDPGCIRLQWARGSGTWVPHMVGCQFGADSLLDLLEANLTKQIDKHPISVLDKLGGGDPEQRKALFQQSTVSPYRADWIAALASDFTPPSANNQLQTARRDYYFGNLTAVISRTSREHLARAIFQPWDYADPLDNQSLHLDPSEDRRHAHQWNKPAGDPDRKNSGGMLGANRLAIEAIVWFISLPEGDALHTIGFTGQRSHNTRWTWPIWNIPLNASTIRSTLTLAELQERKVSADAADRLRRRGVVAAFRTARILVGKTPNFTPAQRIA